MINAFYVHNIGHVHIHVYISKGRFQTFVLENYQKSCYYIICTSDLKPFLSHVHLKIWIYTQNPHGTFVSKVPYIDINYTQTIIIQACNTHGYYMHSIKPYRILSLSAIK